MQPFEKRGSERWRSVVGRTEVHVSEGEEGGPPGAPAVQLPHDCRVLDVDLLGPVDLQDFLGVDGAS